MYAMTNTDGADLLEVEDTILELVCELTDAADRIKDRDLDMIARHLRTARRRLSAVKVQHFDDVARPDATAQERFLSDNAPPTRPEDRHEAPDADKPRF